MGQRSLLCVIYTPQRIHTPSFHARNYRVPMVWEQRDKPFANLGPSSAAFVQDSITQTTLNADILMLINGTYNDATKAQASQDLPDWADRLSLYSISVEDRIISDISRVHGNESDYSDDFKITFTEGESVVRNAIKGTFPRRNGFRYAIAARAKGG